MQREFGRIIMHLLPRYDEVSNRSIDESADTLIDVGISYLRANPQAGKLVRMSLEASADPMLTQFLEITELFTGRVADLVEQYLARHGTTVAGVSSTAIAATLVGSGVALAHHLLVRGDEDLDQVSEMFSTFLRGGLQALAQPTDSPD